VVAVSFPAVELFATRAAAVGARFAPGGSSIAAIAQVCCRLDGLPLAIELAAARAGVLAPEEMRDRLGRGLEVLGEGPRDLPTRQRTLRATIDWSHALLPEAARAVFATLAVFQGATTLDAIERVIEDRDRGHALEAVALLVEHSLVWVEHDGGLRWFSMLQTIQEYARERLAQRGETERTRRRHALYYLELSERAEAASDGPEQLAWLARLDRERDNLLAALAWAGERPAYELGLRLASAMWWYWTYHGRLREGRAVLERLLDGAADVDLPDPVRARALGVLGWLCMHQGDITLARANLDASLALTRKCGDTRSLAFALTGLGSLGVWAGDRDRARQRALLEQARDQWRRLPGASGLHFALRSLGVLALAEGDLPAAATLAHESLALASTAGPYQIAQSACVLGVIAQTGGDADQAAARFLQSLAHSRDTGDPFILAYSLEGLAWVACTEDRAARAACLLGAAAALRALIGSPLASPVHDTHQTLLAEVRDTLGADRFQLEHATGAALTLEQAVTYALDRA
jgi:non-specific serine/threonine protein kinase